MGKRKSVDSTSPNSEFCEILLELAEHEKNVNRNIHKYNAYRKAASILSVHPVPITCGKDARKLNGVGEKIAKKLDEYIETGKLKKLESIRDNVEDKGIAELIRVSGIGPAKARDLVKAGITSIDDLKKNQDKLTHHQLIGLKYVEDFETKIPRKEVAHIEKIIADLVKRLDTKYDITICGSYRRGKLESGDVDVLVTHTDYVSTNKNKTDLLTKLVDALKSCKLVTDTISIGDVKFMGACKVDEITRRLDIRLVPFDQYYCAVLYFTGSDVFNKEMRTHALQRGFTLNEYSLRYIGSTGIPGEPLPITSEKDIFDCIDYPYKEPKERSL